jgi:hypothetical protein
MRARHIVRAPQEQRKSKATQQAGMAHYLGQIKLTGLLAGCNLNTMGTPSTSGGTLLPTTDNPGAHVLTLQIRHGGIFDKKTEG